MNWREAIEEERAMLKRTIALLLSLANLAGIAAGRSSAVRACLIWILRRADIPAQRYVGNLARECGFQLEAFPLQCGDHSVEAALELAERFRELADLLQFLTRRAVVQWRSAARVMNGSGKHRIGHANALSAPRPNLCRSGIAEGALSALHALSLRFSTELPGRIPAPDTS